MGSSGRRRRRFRAEWQEAARDLARFLKLARGGRPYEGVVVMEDLQNQVVPPHFVEAVKH